MSWNIRHNRNLFLKLKSNLRPCHVELTTSKTSLKKLTLTLVEMQELLDIEKIIPEQKFFCLKWTIYKVRRIVFVILKTDSDNLNIVV